MTLPQWLLGINPLDAGAVLFILAFLLLGWKRGLASEIADTLAIGGAIAAVLLAADPLADGIVSTMHWSPTQAYVAAFFILGVTALLAVALLFWMLAKTVKVTFAKNLQRFGGAVVGALRAFALVLIVIYLGQIAPTPRLNAWFDGSSRLGRLVADYRERATSVVEREIESTRDTIRQHRARTEERRDPGIGPARHTR